MSFLVDTNVLSEPAKPKPEKRVVTWLREHEQDLYISAITVGELRRGIERLKEGKRKALLQVWLVELCDRMKGRVLSYNTSAAHVWGQLKARWDREGISIPSLDSQIAAIAHRHGLTIVTRITSDFKKAGVDVLNPFD
ncbi:MAG: type II toxin-antitoxin system VapC family toxin [Opitutaceae bacterium]|nr:type II toxin-antitoxin system VapC family toxin [Opitutaceae bacterium]